MDVTDTTMDVTDTKNNVIDTKMEFQVDEIRSWCRSRSDSTLKHDSTLTHFG